MNTQPMEIKSGIFQFKGKVSRNLLLEPMVSNTYFLVDDDEVVVFDPSCGKDIAKRVEAHIRSIPDVQAKWKRAFLIAGHSHMDHANNFYLSDVIGVQNTHIYVHEHGFHDGKVKNKPIPFIENMIVESKKYYNPFLTYPIPYNLMMYPFAALDALSPTLARKVFGLAGGIPWPNPSNGSVEPEPLKESDEQVIKIGTSEMKGWRLGNKVVLPTPGHSSCSVSLFWPEQRALFVSDADWIGNPVFTSASMKDCIYSLKKLRTLSDSENIALLLPAHGQVKKGVEQVLSYLDFLIHRLEVMKNEILSAYYSHGELKDVRKLTRLLTQESPLFRMLKFMNYPRLVVYVHNIVAVCLKEEGILF